MNHLSNGFSNIEKKMMEEIKQRPLTILKRKEKEKLKFIKYRKDEKKSSSKNRTIYLQNVFSKIGEN